MAQHRLITDVILFAYLGLGQKPISDYKDPKDVTKEKKINTHFGLNTFLLHT